jgi:uncharacterized protein
MKQIIFSLFVLIGLSAFAQAPKQKTKASAKPKSQYDPKFAAKVGADQYGMKKYVLAFLKAGPNRSSDSIVRANLQTEHLKNIQRMANEGKLVVAGPFMDDQPIRGIYIFNVETVEEAKALTETDPAIKAGSLVMELHPFYCSAALVEIPNLHKKLEKKDIAE